MATVTWRRYRRITIRLQRDVDTVDYCVVQAYPLLRTTSDMTQSQSAGIDSWLLPLSRFRMEGYILVIA